jgi:hypothetical protein
VHESQVSRDERNEYHNVTVERAARILDALNAEVHSTVQLKEFAAQRSTTASSRRCSV